MSEQRLREAWQKPEHAELFDGRAHYSPARLRRVFESFNEFRLFLEHKHEIRGRGFVEIGCATGELYRYIRRYHPEFRYHGFDISEPAIIRACQKYPEGRFDTCRPDLSDLTGIGQSYAVVWARDVVHHQPDPFDYLGRLLAMDGELTILRLRTRDKGATVRDPELSCQWHYNQWVPYIVMNMEETLETIRRIVPGTRIIGVKHYVPLGGRHGRYLPKECYYPETGTAETAVLISRRQGGRGSPEVTVLCRQEIDHAPSLFVRGLDYVRQRVLR